MSTKNIIESREEADCLIVRHFPMQLISYRASNLTIIYIRLQCCSWIISGFFYDSVLLNLLLKCGILYTPHALTFQSYAVTCRRTVY